MRVHVPACSIVHGVIEICGRLVKKKKKNLPHVAELSNQQTKMKKNKILSKHSIRQITNLQIFTK